MKKKTINRTVLLVLVSVVIIMAVVLLLSARMDKNSFSNIVAHTDRFTACQILCITVDRDDTVTISGDDLAAFLSYLDQFQYQKGGSYGSTIEGTLYHVYFASQESAPFHMIVSDLGKVYIESDYYELGADVDPKAISDYIDALFQ